MSLPRLYRGLTDPLPVTGMHAVIREDRRPRYTGQHVTFNICFNLMIERRFGIPLVRNRSLFVCGAIRSVIRHATVPDRWHVGAVEPIGAFRFLYEPGVTDSAQCVSELTRRYLGCFHDWQVPMCGPLLEDSFLTLEKLDVFLSSHPEVDTGDFSRTDGSLRNRILAMLDGLAYSKCQQTFDYSDKDLAAAAAAGVEILIFDCPEGYRITPVEASELYGVVPD